jgi:phosphohistidine phosphatase
MKTLYILRHAHSESQDTVLSDFDRPLDEQGREEAEAVAHYLQRTGLQFDFVMCSAALRTQETLELLRPAIGTKSIELSESFYNISEDKILANLKRISDEMNKVLYIGHNPGVAFAILKFATSFPDFLLEGVKPATLVGLQFPIDSWENLDWREGQIWDVFQPSLATTEDLSPENL